MRTSVPGRAQSPLGQQIGHLQNHPGKPLRVVQADLLNRPQVRRLCFAEFVACFWKGARGTMKVVDRGGELLDFGGNGSSAIHQITGRSN